MNTKETLIGLGLATVIYKVGKFAGKMDCLDKMPNKEYVIKFGRHAKLTISKSQKAE